MNVSPRKTEAPTAKPVPDPGGQVRHVYEEFTGLSMQSGPAVAISAFGKLPEQVQRQQLENDAQRDRMNFELETKQLEAMERDREAQRRDRLARLDRILKHEEAFEKRAFFLVVGIVILIATAIIVLCSMRQWMIVSHLATGVLALAAGYQGGRGSGYAKAKKEQARLHAGAEDDDR